LVVRTADEAIDRAAADSSAVDWTPRYRAAWLGLPSAVGDSALWTTAIAL